MTTQLQSSPEGKNPVVLHDLATALRDPDPRGLRTLSSGSANPPLSSNESGSIPDDPPLRVEIGLSPLPMELKADDLLGQSPEPPTMSTVGRSEPTLGRNLSVPESIVRTPEKSTVCARFSQQKVFLTNENRVFSLPSDFSSLENC